MSICCATLTYLIQPVENPPKRSSPMKAVASAARSEMARFDEPSGFKNLSTATVFSALGHRPIAIGRIPALAENVIAAYRTNCDRYFLDCLLLKYQSRALIISSSTYLCRAARSASGGPFNSRVPALMSGLLAISARHYIRV